MIAANQKQVLAPTDDQQLCESIVADGDTSIKNIAMPIKTSTVANSRKSSINDLPKMSSLNRKGGKSGAIVYKLNFSKLISKDSQYETEKQRLLVNSVHISEQ